MGVVPQRLDQPYAHESRAYPSQVWPHAVYGPQGELVSVPQANGWLASPALLSQSVAAHLPLSGTNSQVKEGVDSVGGVEGVLYQVAETLPADVLEKMHAPPKAADVPVISPADLTSFDGFLFGIPTR